MTTYADSFLNESPARQLGALAATLGRVASSAEKTARAKGKAQQSRRARRGIPP